MDKKKKSNSKHNVSEIVPYPPSYSALYGWYATLEEKAVIPVIIGLPFY